MSSTPKPCTTAARTCSPSQNFLSATETRRARLQKRRVHPLLSPSSSREPWATVQSHPSRNRHSPAGRQRSQGIPSAPHQGRADQPRVRLPLSLCDTRDSDRVHRRVLHGFLQGRQSHDSPVLTAITALNVVIRMLPISFVHSFPCTLTLSLIYAALQQVSLQCSM